MNPTARTLSGESVVVAATEQIASDLAGQEIILNLKSGVYYGLNSVGTRIWNLLQQPRSVREIRDALVARYDVDRERAENDLIALLQKLIDAGLVQVKNKSSS